MIFFLLFFVMISVGLLLESWIVVVLKVFYFFWIFDMLMMFWEDRLWINVELIELVMMNGFWFVLFEMLVKVVLVIDLVILVICLRFFVRLLVVIWMLIGLFLEIRIGVLVILSCVFVVVVLVLILNEIICFLSNVI